jgi:hypothetical protein
VSNAHGLTATRIEHVPRTRPPPLDGPDREGGTDPQRRQRSTVFTPAEARLRAALLLCTAGGGTTIEHLAPAPRRGAGHGTDSDEAVPTAPGKVCAGEPARQMDGRLPLERGRCFLSHAFRSSEGAFPGHHTGSPVTRPCTYPSSGLRPSACAGPNHAGHARCHNANKPGSSVPSAIRQVRGRDPARIRTEHLSPQHISFAVQLSPGAKQAAANTEQSLR